MPNSSCIDLIQMPGAKAIRALTSALMLILFANAMACSAQTEPGFPKKTGVLEPGVQRPMSELTPDTEFPVSGHPDWLGVTDDGVWVASSNVNHVVRLNATTNKPDIVIGVAKPCSGLAVGFGSLWIPSCGAPHQLLRTDARTGVIQATIAAGPADSEGGITTGAGSVWLVTSASSELDRIDAATNSIVARIQLPKGSFNPIYAGDSVWVASNEGNALVRVDPATNKVIGSTPIGSKPRFLTVGEGSVWVLNQGDGTVSRVDATTGKLLATIPAGIPGTGGEIAYGGGSVWATVFGFPITRIDPAKNKVMQQWTGKGGDSIRYAHGSLWLTFLMGAKVWRLQVPTP
jgi:virginiamycin B lyase